MNTRTRQGLGWALLGATLWGLVAVTAVLLGGSSGGRVWVDAVLNVTALGGVILVIGGLGFAAVSLIRDRS
jgi:hypothetical protein